MHSKESSSSVHLWMPEIFAVKGGIQTYSAFLLRALQHLSPQVPYQVVLKNDEYAAARDEYDSITKYHFAGAWPQDLRNMYFAIQTVGRGVIARPGLVISTHAHFAGLARYLKRLRGVPYWVVAHGKEVWGLNNPSLKSAFQEASLILSVSAYTRDRLLAEQQLDQDRVVILPNTMDTARFMVRPKPAHLLQRFGITASHPVILTVARLDRSEQYKGYDTVLKSLPAIREAIPNARYIIVGKGDDRPRIEQMATHLGLEGCVVLAGYVPDDELGDYYNLSDVFAMPSKGEGFGIVFLEAMACGKPVLAGNKDGSVDALLQGDLGVLVDPDSIDQIAAALISILNGTYQHPIIYNAQLLRQRVIDAYGFESFKLALSNLLQTRLMFNCYGNSAPVSADENRCVG